MNKGINQIIGTSTFEDFMFIFGIVRSTTSLYLNSDIIIYFNLLKNLLNDRGEGL